MIAGHIPLADVLPDSPRELFELADLLMAHARFYTRCGVAWPTLGDEIDCPKFVLTVLLSLRESRAKRAR